MGESEPQFLEVGAAGRRRQIAYLAQPPAAAGGPGVVWLIGLKSDMASTKAAALAQWTAARGLGLTRFDYSGHGRSSGAFADATIGDWLEESEAVSTRLTSGPQVLVGSSTGGHVALVLLRRLMRERPEEAARVKGLVLIAPAWDLTEELMWKQFAPDARRDIMEKGVYHQPSEYGEPYAITRTFIEEGRHHLLAGDDFDPGRPVLVLQGLQDAAVPAAHTRRLAEVLKGGHVEITEVADGEHRLSRPEDLDKLFALIEDVLARA